MLVGTVPADSTKSGATIAVTSHRSIDEWISLFDDSIARLAARALDRLAHNAYYQVVMEGESFRKQQSPVEATGDRPAPKLRPRRRRAA